MQVTWTQTKDRMLSTDSFVEFILLLVVIMALFASVSLAGKKEPNKLAKHGKGKPVGQGS